MAVQLGRLFAFAGYDSKEKIQEVLKTFVGKSKQLIPMTSAVHVNGRKLYQYLHEGIEVDRPTREVEIKYIELFVAWTF